MANEITVSVNLVNSGLSVSSSWSGSSDQTNLRKSEQTKSVPTTAAGTAFALGDVTTPRWAFFRNMEAVGGNYVQLGIQSGGTFYPFVRLDPQQGCVVRLDQAPYAVANTAAVKVLFAILDG